LLKPHVPEIVHVLVDSLTQLEPQDFNYLALHADKDSQRVLEVKFFEFNYSSLRTRCSQQAALHEYLIITFSTNRAASAHEPEPTFATQRHGTMFARLRPLAFRSLLTFRNVACVVGVCRVSCVSCSCHQLDLCVKYVDESNIGPLAKALQELFARGVGLPTKCGTAHMISSLTMVVRIGTQSSAQILL
jgi:hypothetical protein